MKQSHLTRNDLLFIIIISIVSILNLWLWIAFKDYSSLNIESLKHVAIAREMADSIHHYGIGAIMHSRVYPPLLYLPAIVLFDYLNIKTESAFLCALLYSLPLIIAGTFCITKKMTDSFCAAASATVIAASCQTVGIQYWAFLIDIMLAPFIIMTICFLMYSDNFRRPVITALFGIFTGLGMLMKWTFVIFIIGPCLIAIINWIRYSANIYNLIRFFTALGIASCIALPWYMINLQHYSQHISYSNTEHLHGRPIFSTPITGPISFTPENCSYQLISSFLGSSDMFSPRTAYGTAADSVAAPIKIPVCQGGLRYICARILAVFSVIGIIAALVSSKNHLYMAMAPSSIISTGLIIGAIPTADPRYFMPSTSLFIVCAFALLNKLRPQKLFNIFSFIALLTYLLSMFQWTTPLYHPDPIPACYMNSDYYACPLGIFGPAKKTSSEKFIDNIAVDPSKTALAFNCPKNKNDDFLWATNIKYITQMLKFHTQLDKILIISDLENKTKYNWYDAQDLNCISEIYSNTQNRLLLIDYKKKISIKSNKLYKPAPLQQSYDHGKTTLWMISHYETDMLLVYAITSQYL